MRMRRVVVTALLFAWTASAPSSSPLAADNPIVLENQQPGSNGWYWFPLKWGDDATGQIKGYASAVSVNQNESITFYVSVNPAQTYTIDFYRMGWYAGLGGRLRPSGATTPRLGVSTRGLSGVHRAPRPLRRHTVASRALSRSPCERAHGAHASRPVEGLASFLNQASDFSSPARACF